MSPIKRISIVVSSVALISACSANLGAGAGSKSTNDGFSERLVVWNGESKSDGIGWAGVDQADLDESSIQVTDETAYSGDKSLLFQAAGEKWMGFGWSWLATWESPTGTGVDAREYMGLSFMIKGSGPKMTTLPGLTVSVSSDNDNWSPNIPLVDCTQESLLDGNWHRVVVPVAGFSGANKSGVTIDLSDVKTILFSTWSGEYTDFNIYLDDIAFEK